jgi:hypothetical protein
MNGANVVHRPYLDAGAGADYFFFETAFFI